MSDLTADSGKLQLMAEIERLRAERDKLRGALEDITYPLGEIEGLMAEVEQLKTALRAISHTHSTFGLMMHSIARAALEGILTTFRRPSQPWMMGPTRSNDYGR